MAADELVVHGAREHNLKDVTVRLPRNALICVTGLSGEQIVDQVLTLPEATKFTVNAPVVRDRKGEYRDLFEQLRGEGLTRAKVDGEQRMLDEDIELDKKFKHSIDVVVDRLIMKADLRHRLSDSVETALALADGLVTV